MRPVTIAELRSAAERIEEPLIVLSHKDGYALAVDGSLEAVASVSGRWPVAAVVPACRIEDLGDGSFRRDCGLRYAYVAGAMANGIASEALVEELGRAGMLGFFGAAGLPVARVEAAIDRLMRHLGQAPFGFNLIHSPGEPELEAAIADLYLRRGIRLVEASAYLDLTLPLVRYRVHGIHRGPDGSVVAPNRVIGKISRVEVARKFLSPPPEKLLAQLVANGEMTSAQAEWAREIPVAQDLTAEADSGGHTDNRPAIALLPTILALRDRLQTEFDYRVPLRVGLGGGMSTPGALAAAFTMGAAYVVTGSINQACVESGSSDLVRQMLAEAQQADVAMAPAADMFEMGVKVQVLKRGTLFAMRAAKLYELYRSCSRIEEIPAAERQQIEKTIFRLPLEQVWEETRRFFAERDPRQIERAERDPKHQMALVFRWYLGQSSRWANAGRAERKADFQVWCGPAMGAFNEWTKGTFLEQPENRRVSLVAWNLLYGAAVLWRLHALRVQGIAIPPELTRIAPRADVP